jgi:hypothetical protein
MALLVVNSQIYHGVDANDPNATVHNLGAGASDAAVNKSTKSRGLKCVFMPRAADAATTAMQMCDTAASISKARKYAPAVAKSALNRALAQAAMYTEWSNIIAKEQGFNTTSVLTTVDGCFGDNARRSAAELADTPTDGYDPSCQRITVLGDGATTIATLSRALSCCDWKRRHDGLDATAGTLNNGATEAEGATEAPPDSKSFRPYEESWMFAARLHHAGATPSTSDEETIGVSENPAARGDMNSVVHSAPPISMATVAISPRTSDLNFSCELDVDPGAARSE